jgi:hypothetical protein
MSNLHASSANATPTLGQSAYSLGGLSVECYFDCDYRLLQREEWRSEGSCLSTIAQCVLNSVPTLAVMPIASAPQNITRSAPFTTAAPPARAATPPRRARKIKDIPATNGIKTRCGARLEIRRGSPAPTAKLTADVSAAWIGRALRTSVMPSSSRACACNALWAISCCATCFASAGQDRDPRKLLPAPDVHPSDLL